MAMDVLRKGIESEFEWCSNTSQGGVGSEGEKRKGPAPPPGVPEWKVNVCAEAKLLLARYIDETASLEASSVSTLYAEAKALAGVAGTGSEEVFYHSAKFYDKIIGKNYRLEDLDMKGDIVYHIMNQ